MISAVAGDGGLRWDSDRTCGGGEGDPTAELMTHTKFRSRSSAAGQSRSVPKFPRLEGKESSNRDERQLGRRGCWCREMARRAPLGHVVVRRPMSCHQPATSADCVIRRTPATEPLEGTLEISTGLVGHEVGMRRTVLRPDLVWAWSCAATGGGNSQVRGPDTLRFPTENLRCLSESVAGRDAVRKPLVNYTHSEVI